MPFLAGCVDKPPLRAARANRVFRADEKRIRTENTVMDKNMDSAGFYTRSPIGHGCAFHPCASDDPRGRGAVRASTSATVRYAFFSRLRRQAAICALRAPTVFSARMKSASARKT
ncbi:MAG: hypothetical protein WC830_21295, partial [Burkholderiales bacterium]